MPTYNTGVLNLDISPRLETLEKLNVPFLGRIQRMMTPQSQIKWNVNVGGANSVGEAVTTDVSSYDSDAIKLAKLDIGEFRLRSSFSILETAYTEARARGVGALQNKLMLASQSAQREILSALGSNIFSGSGIAADGGIIGMSQLYQNVTSNLSTDAYAGLDPATDPKWTTLVYNSTGSLTKKKLRDFSADYRNGSTSGVPSRYSVVVASPSTVGKYLEVFDASTSLEGSYLSTADLGYNGARFEGRPIVEDPNLADGVMLFIDESDLELHNFDQVNESGMSEPQATDGIRMYMKELPSANPQRRQFAVFGMYQLALKERASMGVMSGITV
ncbi:MAG: phage major capsid protein [Elainellaceae cyanobacterium]